MHHRLAIAWVLVVVVGLLLGLLVLVVAVGVARHVRRSRHRPDSTKRSGSRGSSDPALDCDEEVRGPGRSRSADDDAEEES